MVCTPASYRTGLGIFLAEFMLHEAAEFIVPHLPSLYNVVEACIFAMKVPSPIKEKFFVVCHHVVREAMLHCTCYFWCLAYIL